MLGSLNVSFFITCVDPDHYAQIPFKAKALKVILKDLEQNTEATELDESPHDDDVRRLSTLTGFQADLDVH